MTIIKVKDIPITSRSGRIYNTGDITTYTSSNNSIGFRYPSSGIVISDGSGWLQSIPNNSANWNTAYSWGNHAGLYAPNTTVSSQWVTAGNDISYNVGNVNVSGVGHRLNFDTKDAPNSAYIYTRNDYWFTLRNSRGSSSQIDLTESKLILSTNNLERFKINQNGNISINTSDEGYLINIKQTSNIPTNGAIINIRDGVISGNQSFAGIGLTSSQGTDYFMGKYTTTSGTGEFQIRDHLSNTLVQLIGNGNIGFGRTPNNHKLEVGGSVYIDGSLSADLTYQNSLYSVYYDNLTNQITYGGHLLYDANVGLSGRTTSSNTVLGYGAMFSAISGQRNVILGVEVARNSMYSSNNVIIGYKAGLNNYNGDSNTFIGCYAGVGVTQNAGVGNTAIGYQSMYSVGLNTSYNVAIGLNSLYYATGNRNVGIGTESLYNSKSATLNVAIGYRAGFSNQTGSSNIFIGYKTGYYETGSNKLYIDNSDTTTPLIYGEFDNSKIKINGNLEVTGTITLVSSSLSFNYTGKYSGFSTVYLYGKKIGKINYLTGSVYITSNYSAPAKFLAKINNYISPSNTIYFTLSNNNNYENANGYVDTSGNIYLMWGVGSSIYYYFNATWIE